MAIRVDKKAIMAAMGLSGADLIDFKANLDKVEAYNSITDIAYDKGQKKIVVKFKNGNSSSFDVAAAKGGSEVDPVDAENTVSVDKLEFSNGKFQQTASVANKTGTGPSPAPYANEVTLFEKGPKGLPGKSYTESKAAAGKETNSVTATKYTKDGKRKVYEFGMAPLFSLSPTGLSASASAANIGIKGVSVSASVSNTSFDGLYVFGVGHTYKAAAHVSEFSGVKAKLCGITLGMIPILGLVSLLKMKTAANQNQAAAVANNNENAVH